MKLTQTQKSILIRMDRGEILTTVQWGGIRAYLSESPSTVYYPTYIKLSKLGLIRQTSHNGLVDEYEISRKGREAIQ